MAIDYEDEQPKGDKLYEFWQEELDETYTFIKERYHNKWKKWLRLDRGEHWQDYEAEDRDYFTSDNPPTKLTMNMLGPWARQLTSYVVAKDGYLNLEPCNSESVYNGILLEAAANYEWKRCYVRQTLEDSFLSAAVIGWVAAETGYTLEVDESINPQDDGILEYRDFVKVDQPFTRKMNQFAVAYDLAAPEKNLDTARWVSEELLQEPSYVLNNERYISSTRKAIRSGDERPETVRFDDSDMPEAMKNLWCLRKVWDKKFRKFYIFLKGCKKPLVEREWPYSYIHEFPVKMFNYIKLPNEWFGTSMFEWLEDGQYELNRAITAMAHYRRTNTGGQSQIAELDPVQIKKYNAGARLIETGDHQITPVATPPFPPDQYMILSHIINNMERISGLSQITQGAESSGRRAATEIRTRAQFTMMRIDGLVAAWDRFVEQIGYDLIKHIQHNYVTPRMQALSGALGSYWHQLTGIAPGADGRHWVTYDQNQLSGDFSLKLESTVKPKQDAQMELQNRMAYVAQLNQLMMIAAQTGKPFDMNPIEVARWLGEANGYDKALPRMVPSSAMIPPPTVTQAGQQQPAQSQLPTDQQQVFAQAATPESAIYGAMQVGNGAPPQG